MKFQELDEAKTLGHEIWVLKFVHFDHDVGDTVIGPFTGRQHTKSFLKDLIKRYNKNFIEDMLGEPMVEKLDTPQSTINYLDEVIEDMDYEDRP